MFRHRIHGLSSRVVAFEREEKVTTYTVKIHNQLAIRVLPQQLRAQPGRKLLAGSHARAYAAHELRLVLKVHVHGKHMPAEERLAVWRGQEEGRYLASCSKLDHEQKESRDSKEAFDRDVVPISEERAQRGEYALEDM